VQEETHQHPNSQGYPFGAREVAWKGGNKLHQEKQQRDTDAQGGDGAGKDAGSAATCGGLRVLIWGAAFD
jgi:hypothetical protein